jgi:prolyl-tRNA synthetase
VAPGWLCPPTGGGLFSYLPLATRLQDKISIVLLEEMKACGNQKLSMPVVHPADV